MLIHFIFILLIIFNCFFELFYKDYKIPQSEKIIITKGMKLSEVSSLLEKKNLIKNKFLFTFWVKLKSSGTKIKFGEYNFDNEISMNKIFFKLTSGDFFYRKITIIEGSQKIDLRNKIKQIYPLEQIEFENIPDYLIADTYLYNITDGASKLINNITTKSNETFESLFKNKIIELPLTTKYDAFILSSIIEKETSISHERFKVAGVFINRLKKGMRLQSDPTVIFAMTKGERKFDRKLLRKDLKYDSDYNTYVTNGLPPSPISFPGLESLNAALNPEKNNYYYFVADPKINGHLFSKEYHQHLNNIKKIKKQTYNDK